MKFASFTVDDRASYGALMEDGGLIDLGRRLGDDVPDLVRLIASGQAEALARSAGATADLWIDEVRFLPPVVRPTTILSTGVNFPGHLAEMVDAGMSKGPPKVPGFHIKAAGSLVGHREPLLLPAVSDQLDWEIEAAAVIATPCYRIEEDRALDHVFGYTLLNDGSVRDYQLGHSVSAGKNFSGSSSLGPWIVTRDDVGPLDDLHLTTRLNGTIVQHECMGDMLFSMARLIAYFSSILRLEPGDIVTSGTCGGVGFFRTPPLYLTPGDRIQFEMDRLGVMEHIVVAQTPPLPGSDDEGS